MTMSLQSTLSIWPGHVVGNAVLNPHCEPLRSASISIGRAHLSLVREVYVLPTIVHIAQ